MALAEIAIRDGVGMKVTHGCLRLYPEDMERLFELVPAGTKVRVINEPYKTAWKDGVLYLEAHPPVGDAGSEPADFGAIRRVVAAAVRARPDYPIDWTWVESLALQPRGVPTPLRRREATRG